MDPHHPAAARDDVGALLCADTGEFLPARSRLLALLAVVESVVFGLATRHAYEHASVTAVPLTLTLLVFFPMVTGYRTVSSGQAVVGTLTPIACILMLLAAGIAQGGAGIVAVVLLTPLLMLFALIGGVLAHGVRAIGRGASHVRVRLARTPASPRGGDSDFRAHALTHSRTSVETSPCA